MATLRKIAGVTRLDGNIAQATLRLYDAATGAFRAETQSDAGTGEYSFEDDTGEVMAAGETFFVLADYGAGVRPLAHGPINPDETDLVLWTPEAVTKTLWLDADDASTFTLTADEVVNWNDKSGNARHCIGSAGSRPSRLANQLNGKAAVVFSNDYLSITGGAPLSANMTVFEVFGRSTSGIISITLGGVAVNAPPYALLWWSDNIRYAGLSDSNKSFTTHGTANTGTGAFVSALRRDTSSIQLWVNGADSGGLKTAMALTNASFSYIGRRASNYHSGMIAEIIVVPLALSSSEREKFEGYLAHKWGLQAGLPSDHPYRINPPYLT